MSRLASAVAVTALAVLAPLSQADAQLGSMIKKKVKEKIAGVEKPAAPAPASGGTSSGPASAASGSMTGYNSDIPYITQANFDAMIRVMNAELALRAEFRKELAKYPTPEQYQACQSRVATTPEAQKIVMSIADVPENATAEQAQKAMAKMSTDMEALLKKSCPNDPNDWPDYKKKQRLEEIRLKALQSTSSPRPVASAHSQMMRAFGRLMFEVDPYELVQQPQQHDTTIRIVGGGLSLLQYGSLIERISKFCEIKAERQHDTSGASDLKVPGTGRDIFWVYSKSEVAVMSKVDCDKFLKTYKELLM
jgi:hypothetical protein